MRRFSSILTLVLLTLFVSAAPARAWLFGSDNTLVRIDGARYSGDDFKRWWQFWNDEKLPLPKTPDSYIDWLLLVREAERMELDADPGFRRQTEVFLKSRALLMLKNEEVNSRITVSDQEIRDRYEKDYLPRWLVRRLEFQDDAPAAAAWQELKAGAVSFADLAARTPEQGGPMNSLETWVRPKGIDPGWAALFGKLEPGAMLDPEEHKQGRMLYQLKERKEGDDEDFAGLREQIQREIWKEKENSLTLALLADLRKQYQVEVDHERIDAIDLNAAEDALTDALVITTSRQNVTERDFVIISRRHLASRGVAAHALRDAEETRKLKDEIVAGVIAQNTTDWAALDRHYEEREPFKWEYDFHVRHRLISSLEERLFAPGAKVSEEEIRRHYEENVGRYSQPAMVKLYILDDTQGPIDQVRADVLVGVPFAKAARDRFERHVSPQEVPANHIDPAVKSVVDKLTAGETSGLFISQGSQVLVHLVDRTPETPLPFERVAGSIRTLLTREKIDQQRRAYLEMLKSRSRIDVRNRQWKALQKELGGA